MENGNTFKLYIEQAGPRFGRYKRGVDIPKASQSLLAPELREEIIKLFRRAIMVNRESKRGFQKARAKRAVELFSPPSSEQIMPQQNPPEVRGFGLSRGDGCMIPVNEDYTEEPPEKYLRCTNDSACTQCNVQQQQQQQQQFYVGCSDQPPLCSSTSPIEDDSKSVDVIKVEEIQNFMNELRLSQQQQYQQQQQHKNEPSGKHDQIVRGPPSASSSPHFTIVPFYQQQPQQLQVQQPQIQPQQIQQPQQQPLPQQQPQQPQQIQVQQSFSPFQIMDFPGFPMQVQPSIPYTESPNFQNIVSQQQQQPQNPSQLQPQLQLQQSLQPHSQQQQQQQQQPQNPSQLQPQIQPPAPSQYCQYEVNTEEGQPGPFEIQQGPQQDNLQGSNDYPFMDPMYEVWQLSGSGLVAPAQESAPRGDSGKGGKDTKNTGKEWSGCTRKIAAINFETPEKERVAVYTETSQVCWDFYRESAQYAQILLSESGVPSKYRTIRMGDLGGVAGGLKFMAVNNILFKSPKLKARNGMLYPDYDVAAKVAGHDFKSAIYFLSAIINTRKSHYKVPLMTLVDYFGYRTVSMTLFPIGEMSPQVSASQSPSPSMMIRSTESLSSSPMFSPPQIPPVSSQQLSCSQQILQQQQEQQPLPQLMCPVCQVPICMTTKTCPTCKCVFGPDQYQELLGIYGTPLQQEPPQQAATGGGGPSSLTASASPPSTMKATNGSNTTLLHGSSDGLHTLCYDPAIYQDLVDVCHELNLKPHVVRSEDGTERLISTPFDMEVHRSSTDPGSKTRYVVDFSRLFPPVQRPTVAGGAEHLYRLFRPEFVRAYRAPLSCDWVVGGTDMEEAEVGRARELLEGPGDDILPFRFAEELMRISVRDYPTDELVFRLHARGINVRYLGLVRERLLGGNAPAKHRSEWVCRVSVEMIARSFRKLLSARLRVLVQRRCRDTFVYQTIAHYLNSLIGRTASTEQLWDLVHADVRGRFVQRGDWVPCLADITACPFGRPTFTELTAGFLGIEYYNDVWRTLQSDAAYNVYEPYNATAIKCVVPRVKQMSLAHYSRGRFLHAQALDMEKSALDQKGFEPPAYLVQSAAKNYETAALRQPGCRICLRQLAWALEEELAKIGTDSSGSNDFCCDEALARRARVLKEKINFVYNIAIESVPRDAITIYNMGVFYDLCGNTASARDFYKKTLGVCSKYIMCLCSLADSLGFDEPQRSPVKAEEIYRHILQDIVKDPAATNNFAVLLCTQNRFLEAAKQFCALIEMSSVGLWYGGLNCIAFCKYILMSDDLTQDMMNTVKSHNSIPEYK